MNTTVDYQTWYEHAQALDISKTYPMVGAALPLMDFQAIYYLKENFTGYMTGPVGLFQGFSLLAKSEIVEYSPEALEQFVHKLSQLRQNDDIFLYHMIYYPATIQYAKSTETGTVILDQPELIKGYWRVRYASLNDSVHSAEKEHVGIN